MTKLILMTFVQMTLIISYAHADDCADLKQVIKDAPHGFTSLKGNLISSLSTSSDYQSKVNLYNAPKCEVTVYSDNLMEPNLSCSWDYSNDSEQKLYEQGSDFVKLIAPCLQMNPTIHVSDSVTKYNKTTKSKSWRFGWVQESKTVYVSVRASQRTMLNTGKTKNELSLTVSPEE